MLNGSFREAQLALSRETPPILDLPEDSPATMELLLRILHHDPTVRRERDDVDICALALACDKYSCTAAIRLWFQAFVSDKKDNCDNHEFVQLIGASYLLDDAFSFLMTTQMVTECWPPGTVEELYASLKAFGAALDDSVVKELCGKWYCPTVNVHINSQLTIIDHFLLRRSEIVLSFKFQDSQNHLPRTHHRPVPSRRSRTEQQRRLLHCSNRW